MGNTELACLPTEAVDLTTGWVTYPRRKTGINRRIPLWAETIDALKAAQAQRPEPLFPADKPLFFISRHRHTPTRVTASVAQRFDRHAGNR